MYIPTKYDSPEWESQKSIIKEFPLGVLITYSELGIIANHVPFNVVERDGKRFLQAHLAKVNHQLPSLKEDKELLVCFQSANSYITPSYYKTKQETHKVVPTWDFAAVHCYGKATLIDDYNFIRKQHELLTNQEEQKRENPWTVDETPEKYYTMLQKAIIGIEIEIDRVEAKYKFEQKMSQADISGVVDGLAKDNVERVSKFVSTSNGLE